METTNQQETQETQENTQDPMNTATNNHIIMQQMLLQNQLVQLEHQKTVEEDRRNHEKFMETRRVKLDMIKIASDTLIENARSKPVSEREITAQQLNAFAEELIQYINQDS